MAFTERLARWVQQRPKRVLLAWVFAVTACVVTAGAVGSVTMSDADQATGAAAEGARVLRSAGLQPDGSEIVVITARDRRALPTGSATAARHLAERIARTDHVTNVRWDGPGLVSEDGRARLITFDLARGDTTIAQTVRPVTTLVRAAQSEDDTLRFEQIGDASATNDIMAMVNADLGRSETLVMPIAAVVLLVTFGALIAAGLPLLLGVVSVSVALSLAAIASHVIPVTDSTTSFVSMLGIALGIDYTLFLLRREREERAAGHSPAQALARAAGSSGYAVFVSGMIVFIALSGMLVSGSKVFVSMGVSAMFVVAVAVASALIVLPAILTLLGDRVEAGNLRRLFGRRAGRGRRDIGSADSRVWGSIVRRAVRRPAVTVAVSGGLLAIACLPAWDMQTGQPSLSAFPDSIPAVAAYTTYAEHFGTGAEPVFVAVRSDSGDTAAVERTASALVDRAGQVRLAAGPVQRVPSADGATQLVVMHLAGADRRDSAEAAARQLRAIADAVPDPDVRVLVTGAVAENLDFTDSLDAHLPWVFLVVLGSAFVLLTAAFRSLVVPVVAVGLNLLSVGAAYGFLVWGFQQKHLDGVIDVAGDGVVVSWMPLFLFVLLFGLSMDYHVFVLSRIRERVLAGFSTRDAIVAGITGSASTITSAALIMVCVFAAFATSRLAEMQQMGAGLAFAVFLDATVVRALLLPAVMSVLGRANWYLPRTLRWLPGVRLERRGTTEPTKAEEPVTA